MAKKLIISITLIFCCPFAFAEDGLVVRFTVEKTEENAMRSYSNGVLMKFNETVRLDFENQYQIKVQSLAKDKGIVHLTVTVKDQTSGKPYYVGVASVEIEIGQEKTVELKQGMPSYAITLDTAYGVLP
ncbi:MAG: hypothetical protein QNJ40_18400 [Xanthomonadales bacterium]|nr:hypothetical protein [Xanthomonadales bacterium]